jgi:predicted DNA repair protein MutK
MPGPKATLELLRAMVRGCLLCLPISATVPFTILIVAVCGILRTSFVRGVVALNVHMLRIGPMVETGRSAVMHEPMNPLPSSSDLPTLA